MIATRPEKASRPSSEFRRKRAPLASFRREFHDQPRRRFPAADARSGRFRRPVPPEHGAAGCFRRKAELTRANTGPGLKIAKTTPCKVEWGLVRTVCVEARDGWLAPT